MTIVNQTVQSSCQKRIESCVLIAFPPDHSGRNEIARGRLNV
jgi:hypothetical protein